MKIVKRVLLITGILLLATFLIIVSKKPFVPDNYTKTVKTGGEIEAKYMAKGTYEVSCFEEQALQGFGKYIIYYPSEIGSTDQTIPAVVVANGSGCKASKYPALFEHLASWGGTAWLRKCVCAT